MILSTLSLDKAPDILGLFPDKPPDIKEITQPARLFMPIRDRENTLS